MHRAGSTNDGNREPLAERRFQAAARSPSEGSQVRRQLVECLTTWRCDRVDDVALVFSEMVTNAVLHGGGAVLISACPTDDDRHLRLEVYDTQAATPVPCTGGPNGGFGLQIIDRLTERWGTTPTREGKVVWAVIRSGFGGPSPG